MTEMIKDVFGIVDYIVFAIMLAVSGLIGVYYGFASRKTNDTQEFLMGGRSLSVFPVAMSVLASFMSAITLLGAPSEVYRYGAQYIMICFSFCLVIPATAYLYLPVFYNLNITSAYEYLELRFNRFVRTVGSTVFSLHMLMYMPVVLYAPALALAEVTGLSIWFSVLSVGLVCTFYTSIGGMKAVVWTDLFQSIIMYASIFVVVIKGTYDIGGIELVWERSYQGQRTEFFNFDTDPTVRYTFWTLVIGGYITWMGNYAANQAMIQRYLTISTLRGAQRCLWINLPALLLLKVLTVLAGLVIFAYYASCDPIGTKMIDAPDQLFPRFVMETLRVFPGVPGLFVSGIFSGALSTVSSGVNSLAAVSLEDIIKTYIAKDISELWATRITKALAMLFGLISIALVFVAQQLGGVLQAALTIHGIVGGPMFGLFTLGMFLPWTNSWGASMGVLCGFTIAMWFGMGAFVYQPYSPQAPYSYVNCTDHYSNITEMLMNTTSIPNNDEIFPPYRLSYLWLSAVGFLVTLIVGIIFSFITGAATVHDERLLSPVVLWLKRILPTGNQKILHFQRDLVKDSSIMTLRTTSVISDDSFYPTKKASIASSTADSKTA